MDSRLFQFEPHEHAAQRSALLRALADGEIHEREVCERLGVASLNDADRAAVGFERSLRQYVKSTMASDCAPPCLRDRVVAALENQTANTTHRPLSISSWLSRLHTGTFAAAAVLVLAAGIVWVMYNRAVPSQTQIAPAPSLLLQTASAAFDTHRAQDSGSLWAIKKSSARDEASTLRICKEWLGHEPDLSRLCAESAELVGAGTCELPNALGRSVHILVTVPCGGGVRQDASLFIMRDQGRLEVGAFGIKDVGNRCAKNASVLVWREDGLVYLLVTRNAEVAATLSDQLGIEPIIP